MSGNTIDSQSKNSIELVLSSSNSFWYVSEIIKLLKFRLQMEPHGSSMEKHTEAAMN